MKEAGKTILRFVKDYMRDITLRHELNDLTQEVFGFAPCAEDSRLFIPQPYDGGDDYRLFFCGEDLKSIEADKLYFPEFSHA